MSNLGNFKELDKKLKEVYYNFTDDPVATFLIPILNRTKIYKRETYSFTSGIYSLLSKPMGKLIRNNAKIKYIVGVEIPEKELEAIEKGIKTEGETIERIIIEEFGGIEEVIKSLNENRRNLYACRLAMLSYLISKGILKIKVGFIRIKGKIKSTEKHKFHQKIMMFEDFDGNKIVTNGSVNETIGGMINNQESFDAFYSWRKGTESYIRIHEEHFEKFWNNKTEGIITLPIGRLIEENLLKKYSSRYASKEELLDLEEKLGLLLENEKDWQNNKKELWNFQREAIGKWVERNRVGIFSMATGTGKTFTALKALEELSNSLKEPLIIVIATPKSHISSQWSKEIKKNFLINEEKSVLMEADSSHPWRKDIKKKLLELDNEIINKLYIVTTHITGSSEDFIKAINGASQKVALILDEVHGAGSEKNSNIFLEKYLFRLGLSATPSRYFDDEGTRRILDFFNEADNKPLTYEFSLERALKEINPKTGRPFLAPYTYHPIFISLTKKEIEDYRNLTKKYVIILSNKNLDIKEKKSIERRILFNRSRIIKNAANKMIFFDSLIKELGEVNNCLVYCTEGQIKEVSKILDKRHIKRIFYSSSACMYPEYNQMDPDNPNCAEESAYPAAPDSEYGWEKLFSERLYLAYKRNYGMEIRIARYHNIFGPEGTWKGGREKAPAALCRKVAEAKDGGRIEIWGSGERTRSFLYIDECIEGTLKLMRSDFTGPVNIGSDEIISINNLAEMVIEIAGKKLKLNHIDGPLGVMGRNSDNKLIEQKLSWRPSRPLREGIEKAYMWIEEQVEKEKLQNTS